MSTAEEFRRLFPPPRRRPGPLTVLVRWRAEIAIVLAVAAVWWYAGGAVVLTVAAALAVLLAVSRPARRRTGGLLLAIVVPHRVRSGLIQAGVTDRAGRPPWVVRAWTRGETVFVSVWLRSGTTPADLQRATGVIGSACGAAHVEVTQFSARQDRSIVVVYRPRWGRPGT